MELVSINQINLDTAQPRQVFREDKLTDLANDIKQRGLLYPVLLTPYYKDSKGSLLLGKKALETKKHKWWVLDGDRRIRAMKILKNKEIEAIVKLNLDMLQMLEIQFASNSKRIQVTIEEMAKSITRFKKEFYRKNPEGNVVEKLVELTGFSPTYFEMAEAINRAPNEIRDQIFEGKIGGYFASEVENATKDQDIRDGVYSASLKARNSGKRFSALMPRAIKRDLRKIEEKTENTKIRKELAESITDKYINQDEETIDEKADYNRYSYEIDCFHDLVKCWNVKGLSSRQTDILSSKIRNIYSYLLEEKRRNDKLAIKKGRKKSKNIWG